jgi:hypothetical protein
VVKHVLSMHKALGLGKKEGRKERERERRER